MSCAGNGYLSGNMLVPFPFEDGQMLAWSSGKDDVDKEAQRLLERCFVDAGVNVLRENFDGGWPSIGGFSAYPSRMSFSVSACGMDTLVCVDEAASGFPIASGKAPFGSYVVVMSSEGIRDFLDFCSDNSISPPVPGSSSPSERDGVFLRLCAKCVFQAPVGLESIRVYDGVKPKADGPHFILTGNVSVKPGNNILLSEPDMNGMQISAMPGAGLGVIPCSCENKKAARSPIMSPDGHTRIFNDTCYDIEPWIENVEEDKDGKTSVKRIGHIRLHAKCTACCTCSMYESIVNERLVPLAEAIREMRSEMEDGLSSYESAVGQFNQRAAKPSLSDMRLSLSGMPVGKNLSPKLSDTNVKGNMSRCAFTAILRNSSYYSVTATVYSLSGTDTVVEATAAWTDEAGTPKSKTFNSASEIIGQSFNMLAGTSIAITFVSVKDEMVGSASAGGYTGSISVGMSYSTKSGKSGSLGIISKTVEV